MGRRVKLIDRYLTRELLVNLFFAVAVLSFALVLGNIFRKLLPLLVNRDVPAEYIFSFIAYILPFSLIFTIPWGFLTSVLLVFGRLSADNELTAMRSNGMSLTRICLPLFLLALVLAGVCLWLTVRVAPSTREKLTSTMFDLATRNPLALFESDQIIDQFPGRKIYVGKKRGNTLENIMVFEYDDRSLPLRVTFARTGSIETDLPNQRILLRLHKARYQQRDPDDPFNLQKIRDGISLEEGTLPISLSELYDKTRKRPGRSGMSLEQLLEELNSGSRKDRSASRTEINKRFSFPLSCLAFALVAVPLGITAHRRETVIGWGVSVVVAFTYFVFIILADTLRENPNARPELLVWLPNILFLVIGSLIFWRVAKR